MKKINIGTLIEFKLRKKKVSIKGVLLDYSDEWTLLFNNPVDYILDGFILINNKEINAFKEHKKSLEDVILRKKMKPLQKPHLNISNISSLLSDLKNKKSTISIETIKEKSFLVGRIIQINKEQNTISVTPLAPNAKWEQNESISIMDIKIIEFGTDYIESLLLVAPKLR